MIDIKFIVSIVINLGFFLTSVKKQGDTSKLSTHITEETGNEEKPMFLTCNVTQESSKMYGFWTAHATTT